MENPHTSTTPLMCGSLGPNQPLEPNGEGWEILTYFNTPLCATRLDLNMDRKRVNIFFSKDQKLRLAPKNYAWIPY